MNELIKSYNLYKIPADGDCWIRSVITGLAIPKNKDNHTKLIGECRLRVYKYLLKNKNVHDPLNVKSAKIKRVLKQAIYNKKKLRRMGEWGELWHLPVLAIVLNIDIVALNVEMNHFSYMCSSGVNIFYPPKLTIQQIPDMKDAVILRNNSQCHFDLLEKHRVKWNPPGWIRAYI